MEHIQPSPKSPITPDFYALYYSFAHHLYSIYSDNDYIDPIQALTKFKNTLNQSFLSQQMDHQFGLIIQIFIQTGLLSNENSEPNKPETLQLSPSWRHIINHITKSVRKYNKAGKRYVPKTEEIQIGENRKCRTIAMLGQLVLNELRNGADSREKISEKTGFARQRICTVLSVFKAIGVVKEFGTRRKLKIKLNRVQERFLPQCHHHLHELNRLKNSKREIAKETFELLEKLKEKRKLLKSKMQISKYQEMIKKNFGNFDYKEPNLSDPNSKNNYILDPNSKILPQLKETSELDRIKNKRNLDQTCSNNLESNHKNSIKPRKEYLIRTKKKKYKLLVGYNSNRNYNNTNKNDFYNQNDFYNKNYSFNHFNSNTLIPNSSNKNYSNNKINNHNENNNEHRQIIIDVNINNKSKFKMDNCNFNNMSNNRKNEVILPDQYNFKKQDTVSIKTQKIIKDSSYLNFNKHNQTHSNNNNNLFNEKKTMVIQMNLPKQSTSSNEYQTNDLKINLKEVSENKFDDFLKTALEGFSDVSHYIQNQQGENKTKIDETKKEVGDQASPNITPTISPFYNFNPNYFRYLNSSTTTPNLNFPINYNITPNLNPNLSQFPTNLHLKERLNSPPNFQSTGPFMYMDSSGANSPFSNMKMRVPPSTSPFYYLSPSPVFSNHNLNTNSNFPNQLTNTTTVHNHPSFLTSSDQNQSELLLQKQNQVLPNSQQNPILENTNQPNTLSKVSQDRSEQPQFKTPIFQKRGVSDIKKFFGFGFK
ncbi:hypothetical protein M0813_27996 [Anaeramoeba flamelloides]|uniref:Uncharacterized protein n=1 Tax=Anaeramoeba flamelloides TaxID=1746091 RepID=A0ABQ8XUF4_9EUKA|nr:hypothetical protein M0813_27996 [Anaeramoeba flamelloides]